MDHQTDRLERLETALERQELQIAELRSQLAVATESSSSIVSTERAGHERDAPQARSTRRSILAGGAVAAGAAVVGAVAKPGSVAAADGGNMIIGGNNNSAAGNTRIRSNSAGTLTNTNVFTVTDNQSSSSYPAAIGGVAQGVKVTNGMYAYASTRGTSTTTGHAVVARKTTGGRSHVYMVPSGGSPVFDNYAHARGELRVDNAGSLWYCTESGSPGRWLRLAAQTSSGAVHAITPTRVYDSRFADGPLLSGFNRLVSVADGIDVETGAVVQPNVVPAFANAVMFNLSVTETAGGGFVFVGPGGATEVTSSTINWSTSGATIANASMSTLDDNRQVRVFAGGAGSAHMILDITGYLL